MTSEQIIILLTNGIPEDINYFAQQKGQACKENKRKGTATYEFDMSTYISAHIFSDCGNILKSSFIQGRK
jgi:hypothetical protein